MMQGGRHRIGGRDRLGATACPGKKYEERKNTAHQEWAPLGDKREVGVHRERPQGGLWHVQRTARECSLGKRGRRGVFKTAQVRRGLARERALRFGLKKLGEGRALYKEGRG